LAAIFITAIHTGTEHYGVNNVAILQVVARFVVNVVDANLLQPTRPVEPKSPSKVAPELITVKTAVFTGLLPT
jgi:hypothetical protein